MQKPWSCDDSMGGNTIVREGEPRGAERPAEPGVQGSGEHAAVAAESDLRPRV